MVPAAEKVSLADGLVRLLELHHVLERLHVSRPSQKLKAHLVASVDSRFRSLDWEGGGIGDPERMIAHPSVHDTHDFILAAGSSMNDLESASLGVTLTILIRATADILTTWK